MFASLRGSAVVTAVGSLVGSLLVPVALAVPAASAVVSPAAGSVPQTAGGAGQDRYGPESGSDLSAANLASAQALASARGQRVQVEDRLSDRSTTYVLPDG